MNQHKIALLDLGGVVFQSTGVSNKKINWDIISRLNKKYGNELSLGEDKFPDFLVEYNELSNQSLSGQKFLEEIWQTLEMNTELVEIVRAQSDIIIVSDNYRENIDYVSKKYNFNDWSIQQIYSFDYKMLKSNPDFFKRLITDIDDYSVGEMIFIDDSIKKIESAAKSGIKGILYQDNEQIRKHFHIK